MVRVHIKVGVQNDLEAGTITVSIITFWKTEIRFPKGTVQTWSWNNPASLQEGTAGYTEVKTEDDFTPPSNAYVKNKWRYTFSPHMFLVWRAVNNKDTFTITGNRIILFSILNCLQAVHNPSKNCVRQAKIYCTFLARDHVQWRDLVSALLKQSAKRFLLYLTEFCNSLSYICIDWEDWCVWWMSKDCESSSAVACIKMLSQRFLVQTEGTPNHDGQPPRSESNTEHHK